MSLHRCSRQHAIARVLIALSILVPVVVLAAPPRPPPPAPTPVGYVIDESGCASGGPAYYFFADGKVVMDWIGSEDRPNVSEGTWAQTGLQLTMKFHTLYLGKGSKVIEAASVYVYESYSGEVRSIDEVATVAWYSAESGDCDEVKKHSLEEPSARTLLKGAFKGDYPFLSKREVTEADLAGKTKDELSKMRNEVFASYGHIFKNAALAKHFKAMKGYWPRLVDVTAFLSPLEKKNVEAVITAEKNAK